MWVQSQQHNDRTKSVVQAASYKAVKVSTVHVVLFNSESLSVWETNVCTHTTQLECDWCWLLPYDATEPLCSFQHSALLNGGQLWFPSRIQISHNHNTKEWSVTFDKLLLALRNQSIPTDFCLTVNLMRNYLNKSAVHQQKSKQNMMTWQYI